MECFPLSNLHATLLEKIINKLHEKSYFRIQQTCRDMEEFIRTNRNISIFADMDLSVKLDENKKIQYLLEDGATSFPRINELKSLYGIRFFCVTPRRGYTQQIHEFLCSEFEKFRITCNTLDLEGKRGPSKEQTDELLKILKPVHVRMNSKEDLHRYFALMTWPPLKEISVDLYPRNLIFAMVRLTPLYSTVCIAVEVDKSWPITGDYEKHWNILEDVIDFLYSMPLPKLELFDLFLDYDRKLPSVKKQLKRLAAYHPKFLRSDEYGSTYLCRFVRKGPFFEIGLTRTYTRIHYVPEHSDPSLEEEDYLQICQDIFTSLFEI